MLFKKLFLLLLIFTSAGLWAREWEGVYFEENTPPAPEPSLIRQTLARDLESAGYYDLLEWSRTLGLPEKGDVKELRGQLYTYYGITQEAPAPKKSKKTITIKSARTTEYFSLSEVEEKYILLEGDILLEMKDEEQNTKHTIRAQQILYNQSARTITALGDITYTLNEKGKEEVFTGTSMNFNVDTWEGLFFEGTTESGRTVENKEIIFYITGDSMYRSGEDAVILTNGTITSSDLRHPYYHIRAKKIWILSPGEWALENAVLYVGTVPLFYIPFFFKTGDEIFFHPSMGLRTVEGFAIQTTTYLQGERVKKDEPFSFLQIYDQNEEDYKKEIKGLYLRKTRLLTDQEKKEKSAMTATNSYLKILLDFYTRLGFFGGLEGNVSNSDILDTFYSSVTLARSRDIYYGLEGEGYSVYRPGEDGTVSSRWNESRYFSLLLPFRFGIFSKLILKNNNFTFSTALSLFSDPFYLRDFNRREEQVNWSKFLGLVSEDSTVQDINSGELGYAPGELGYAEIDRQQWFLNLTARPDMQKAKPWINELNVSTFDVSLTWKNKELDAAGYPGLDPDLPGYIPETSWTDYSFPERRFFYPDSYLLPGISFKISGDLFNTAREKTAEDKEKKQLPPLPGAGVKVPWSGAENEEKEAEKPAGPGNSRDYRIPDRGGNVNVPFTLPGAVFNQQLSYSVNPNVTMDNRTLSAEWNTPAEIDFTRSYSLLSAYGSTSLSYKAAFLEKLVLFQDAVTLTGDIRKHFYNTGLTEEEMVQYDQDDNTTTFLKLGNSVILTAYPLLQAPLFKESFLSYQLNALFFKHRYDYTGETGGPVYTTFPAEWTKDFVEVHKTNARLSVLLLEKQQTFDFQAVLPPLVPLISLSLTGRTGPFTTILSQSYEKPEGEGWKIKPFTITEQIAVTTVFSFEQFFSYNVEQSMWTQSRSTAGLSFFDKKLSLAQSVSFGDFNEADEIVYDANLFSHPFSAVTTLKAWWFTGEFTARRFVPYHFDAEQGWLLSETEEFRPEKLSLSFLVKEKGDPFWKNRVQVTVDSSAGVIMNFNKFTDSIFTLTLGFTLKIAEFLDFSFSLTSENRQVFKYFPDLAALVGVEPVSFFTDLGKSLNVFNETTRRETAFIAKRMTIKAVHYLKDWNLVFEFSAFPELTTRDDGFKYYEWERQFSIMVKWNPVPEIKSRLSYKAGDLSF